MAETSPESAKKPAGIKTVTSRKILYAEIDDEVTILFDRIKATKLKDVYVVVPRQATLFQSLVNLKILKRKVEELGKTLHIITDDATGVHLTHQAGIPVYERLETQGGYVPKADDETLRITPLKATVNTIDDAKPTRLQEKKLSIPEILGRGRRRPIPIVSRVVSFFKSRETAETDTKFVVVAPNRQALIALVAISALLVLAVFYIALPSATLAITPKSRVMDQSINVVFADYDMNKVDLDAHPPKTLASHQIATTIRRVVSQRSTGKIFQGTNARGRLTVLNSEGKAWPLVAKTRFQTSDGIVFRLQQMVTIPPARGGQPGMLDVDVAADEFDAYGQPIGERGNIKPMQLFLPGLNPENQKKLHAEVKVAFAGGSTAVRTKISANDIAAGIEKVKQELTSSVDAELTRAIGERNALFTDQSRFALLKGKLAYEIGTPRVTVPTDLDGKELDQFEVTGELDVKGYYFNMNEMLEMLRGEIKLRKSPDTRITKIDDTSISYRIFDVDVKLKKITATATIKAIEEFDLNPGRENGERLIQKIKEHVVGRKLQDAKDYILNLPEVAAVDIKPWPIWAPTLPGVPDNINVAIVSAP